MNNEFEHTGVKGMKWGVRRYQNSDGSLTSEGKKRYKSIKFGTRGQVKKLYKAETKEDRDKAASKLIARKEKAAKKIGKLESQNDKFEKVRNEQITKSEVRAAQYQSKADYYSRKAAGRFQTENSSMKNFQRANMYQLKANEIKSRAASTKAKMAGNAKMRELLNTEMNNIDSFLKDAGYKYVKNLKG